MLTLAKIDTYRRFDGDIDGFVRSNGKGDRSGVTSDDWALIDRLCQAMQIVASGNASKQFALKTARDLAAAAPALEVRTALERLASG